MKNLYQNAIDAFIDLSTKDVTATISKEHAIIGLNKLLNCYSENGIVHDQVRIVALPDFTFTRNQLRWKSGFAYGCLILLQPNVDPIIPLDCRPNCCGVILTKIPKWNENRTEFCQRLLEIINSYERIDLDDFKRRNHFVAILKDEGDNYFALFHGSFASVKRDTDYLPGLYSEKSSYWNEKTRAASKFNDFKYLIGEDAQEYFQVYKKHEEFTLKQRELVFDDLFEKNHEVVFNETHEGLYDSNTILMGGYASKEAFNCPVMLSPESDIPIVENTHTIKELSKGNCQSDLYCSPHGGGYSWTYVATAKIEKGTGHEYAELTMSENQSVMYCDNIGDMPFQYRTNVATYWTEEKNAGHIKSNLQPVFFAKF